MPDRGRRKRSPSQKGQVRKTKKMWGKYANDLGRADGGLVCTNVGEQPQQKKEKGVQTGRLEMKETRRKRVSEDIKQL